MATLTVKGSPMTQVQKNVATALLTEAKQQQASTLVMQAIIFAAIMESDLGTDVGPNSGGYMGPLQGNASYFGKLGSASSLAVLTAEVDSFINGGNGFQSATQLESQFQNKPGLLAAKVEEPTVNGTLGPSGYGQYIQQGGMSLINQVIGEAALIVQAHGGGGVTGSTSGTSTGTKSGQTAPFYVGGPANPSEDVWTAINRLAQARYWYLFALETTTPVPTPSGWTTMGALEVGDLVLGTDGRPVRVTATSPTYIDRKCLRVEFKDGSSIVADADHRWYTVSHYRGQGAVKLPDGRWAGVRTTHEIAESILVRGQDKYNHSIPTATLRLPEVDLPIDPYILGYWLGDGSKTNARITVGHTDKDHVVGELNRAGLQITNDQPDGAGSQLHFGTGTSGEFTKLLRQLDVYDNKHVPRPYLRASHEQRLALLQGLMDSDGGLGNKRCLFSNVNRRLADDVRELLRTFGVTTYRSVVAGGKKIYMPRGHVSVARDLVIVAFPTTTSLCPFRLPRKKTSYEAVFSNLRGSQHREVHRIKSVSRTKSVPVRCISVDAPDRLYLVGEAFVPTHNSDGEVLYLADGTVIMQQDPALTLDRWSDVDKIVRLSFTWDNSAFQYTSDHRKRRRIVRKTQLAKVTSPVEAELSVICPIDYVRAGDVVMLTGCGPGDGKWLVGDCRRSIFKIYSELTLVPATTALTEQQAAGAGLGSKSNADVPGAAAANAATIIAALDSAATTINSKGYPYVSYGGRAQAGTPDPGHPGEGFYDGHTAGFDAAGAIAAVLAAAGLWTGAVPDALSIVAKLEKEHFLVPGRGGGVPEFSLFYGKGYFFCFINASGAGQYWGTGDGGGVSSLGPSSFPFNPGSQFGNFGSLKKFPNFDNQTGGTWLNPPPSLSGFQEWHIPQNILGDLLNNAAFGSLTGSYVNPFKKASSITPNRIDQGVDYDLNVGAPILAIGDAQVLITFPSGSGSSGWPGGGWISYKLTDGPYQGKMIYVAENINPTVGNSATVTAGQQIATFVGGSSGLETGWASGNNTQPLAQVYHQQAPGSDPGAWSSAAGLSFNSLLVSLGAPSGQQNGNGRHGSPLPSGYPNAPWG